MTVLRQAKFALSGTDFNPRTGNGLFLFETSLALGKFRRIVATSNTRAGRSTPGHIGEQADRIGDQRPQSRRELSCFRPQSRTNIRSLPETVRSGVGSVTPSPPPTVSSLGRTNSATTLSSGSHHPRGPDRTSPDEIRRGHIAGFFRTAAPMIAPGAPSFPCDWSRAAHPPLPLRRNSLSGISIRRFSPCHMPAVWLPVTAFQ